MARDYDLIIVGSGAAGLSAAVAAADEGASVLIVEGDTRTGGSSRLSGGHFYAAGTSVQQTAGIGIVIIHDLYFLLCATDFAINGSAMAIKRRPYSVYVENNMSAFVERSPA